jgi:ribonuclease-3
LKPKHQLQRYYNRFFRYSDHSFFLEIGQFLGYYPLDLEVYQRAFRHKSISNKKGDNNERLEFLGDSILDAIVADYLIETFPRQTEGFLTKLRARIVSRKTLNTLAENLDLKRFVIASKNAKSGRTSLYGNALEALVGAIYIDCGYDVTKEYVLKILQKHIDMEDLCKTETDYKSRLLEWAQKEKVSLNFKTKELPQTEDGNYQFSAAVIKDSVEEASAIGSSKKRAEQKAAELYWNKRLNN